MVGMLAQLVIRQVEISRPARSRSQRGMMTMAAPVYTQECITLIMPVAWNIGTTASETFSALPFPSSTAAAAWCMMVAWECIQPLGRPVVPLVYGSTARSCGPARCEDGSRPGDNALLQSSTRPSSKSGAGWRVPSHSIQAAGGAFSPCARASKASVKCVMTKCDKRSLAGSALLARASSAARSAVVMATLASGSVM